LKATMATLLTLGALLLMGTGCATRRDVVRLEEHMDRSDARQREIQGQVTRLDSIVAKQGDLLYSLRAELKTGLDKLSRNIEEVGEAMKYGERPEEYTLGPLAAGDTTAAGGPAGDLFETPPEDEGTVVAEGSLAQQGSPPAGETAGGEPEGMVPQKEEVYDTAYLDMVRGNYDLAISGFREFIASGKKQELKDNAQYWIGECRYAQGNYDEAITEFQKVVDEYPRGNKVPSALFKIGKSYYELGDSDEASRYFNAVIGGYPHSEEAKLAKEYLSDLR
jgi:tol-pal system protein YbgF